MVFEKNIIIFIGVKIQCIIFLKKQNIVLLEIGVCNFGVMNMIYAHDPLS